MHVYVFLLTISNLLCSSIACVSMLLLSLSFWVRLSLTLCSSLHFTATFSSTFWEFSIKHWPSATTDLTLSSTSCRERKCDNKRGGTRVTQSLHINYTDTFMHIGVWIHVCDCKHYLLGGRLTQNFFSWLVSSWRRCSVWAGLIPTSEKAFSVSVACSSSFRNYK